MTARIGETGSTHRGALVRAVDRTGFMPCG
jgi:hypothetical protein